ncbi:MAG: hypothetical protein JO186_10945 [Actinobacteria bacterium]|nr:hypothetical protein [Actinomycetota bacterium]MBV8395998.1 hypothetical protein [Actinomycetota bacterium]MBV8597450.1 hypothetical protein [Actinomycetota bacterium]
MAGRQKIEIRWAEDGDERTLRRLAALSSRALPAGPFLLAATDGEPSAAISVATGEVVSDPFVATFDLVALLELRSRHLAAAA